MLAMIRSLRHPGRPLPPWDSDLLSEADLRQIEQRQERVKLALQDLQNEVQVLQRERAQRQHD